MQRKLLLNDRAITRLCAFLQLSIMQLALGTPMLISALHLGPGENPAAFQNALLMQSHVFNRTVAESDTESALTSIDLYPTISPNQRQHESEHIKLVKFKDYRMFETRKSPLPLPEIPHAQRLLRERALAKSDGLFGLIQKNRNPDEDGGVWTTSVHSHLDNQNHEVHVTFGQPKSCSGHNDQQLDALHHSRSALYDLDLNLQDSDIFRTNVEQQAPKTHERIL